MKKYIYIIDYWENSPASEYGGLVNVIASSDEEVLQLLIANYMPTDSLTLQWIAGSIKFRLYDYAEESRVVHQFYT